jgi:hypothetical protein
MVCAGELTQVIPDPSVWRQEAMSGCISSIYHVEMTYNCWRMSVKVCLITVDISVLTS